MGSYGSGKEWNSPDVRPVLFLLPHQLDASSQNMDAQGLGVLIVAVV